MTARNVSYWISTGLVAFAFAFGGVADLARFPDMIAGMSHLGYPVYLASLLGLWKVLGAIAVLAPGNARLKEWAYAGMFFDLTGAAYSHASSGDPLGKILTPLILLGIVVASWALRSGTRALPREAQPESAPAIGRGELASAKG